MLNVYQLLKKYHIRAKKSLGQNFLADQNHLQKIVTAAGLSSSDTVLEIGPGLGTLTALLTQAAKSVVAVEVDPAMVDILHQELAAQANLTVCQADILTVEPAQLLAEQLPHFSPGDDYAVVANLPYYITSAIIQHLLEADHPPHKLVITMQKEVAQRIVAQPGDLSILAISVQFYGQPTLCHTIPAAAFVPAPKVDSAVLRIDRYEEPPVAVSDIDLFFQVVKAGFSQKRKQLKNSLASGLHQPQAEVMALLEQANIEPSRRAQTLSLSEWAALTQTLLDR